MSNKEIAEILRKVELMEETINRTMERLEYEQRDFRKDISDRFKWFEDRHHGVMESLRQEHLESIVKLMHITGSQLDETRHKLREDLIDILETFLERQS